MSQSPRSVRRSQSRRAPKALRCRLGPFLRSEGSTVSSSQRSGDVLHEHLPDVVSLAVQHGSGGVNGHADNGLRRDERRRRRHQLHWLHLYVQQGGTGCASQVWTDPSSSPAFETKCPQRPTAFATSPKLGFLKSVYTGSRPAAFCSISTNPSLPLS